MIRKMGYRWHLRRLMADRDMFNTSDLVPLLAERGVHLSREQVFRLVTGTPQRLSLDTLAALCDILQVGVQDLIEIEEVGEQVPKTAAGSGSRRARSVGAASGDGPGPSSPRRTTVRRPPGL